MQNVAPRLSATPSSIRSPAPELGEHNADVYRELLGIDAVALAGYHSRGVI
jgi:formyl-CoA transferase